MRKQHHNLCNRSVSGHGATAFKNLPQRQKKINVDIKAKFRYPKNDRFPIFYKMQII
jgi:hypothetical protein